MSDLMRHYMAGQLAHAQALTYFLAPYVNSYKRFVTGLFAPTKAIWSIDNRTAGFRVCGDGTRGMRVECRIGGADLNPIWPAPRFWPPALTGSNASWRSSRNSPATPAAQSARQIPKTLGAAARRWTAPAMLRAAPFRDRVIDHYLRAAEWELEEHDRVVTDWELARGFERA